MKIKHQALIKSLKTAYSTEKAASLAYIGQASALRNTAEILEVKKIEQEEWDHRRHVFEIMN